MSQENEATYSRIVLSDVRFMEYFPPEEFEIDGTNSFAFHSLCLKGEIFHSGRATSGYSSERTIIGKDVVMQSIFPSNAEMEIGLVRITLPGICLLTSEVLDSNGFKEKIRTGEIYDGVSILGSGIRQRNIIGSRENLSKHFVLTFE